MSTRNIEDIYPLSPMQQGMLFHSLLAPEGGVYVEQMACTLSGALDVAAFERAWQQVIARHAILRTGFVWEDVDEPLQVVQRQVAVPLERHDWRGMTAHEQRDRLQQVLADARHAGFDLSVAPLLRLTLIQTASNSYEFAWTHHHLLLDGWSLPIVLQEVFTLYTAFAQHQPIHLPAPRPYREYIAWLKRQVASEAEAYWRQTLAGFIAPTPLAIARAAHGQPDAAISATQSAMLPAATTAALQATAQQLQITLNTLVQGAWALLLSRYSGTDDVLFGVTVAGRPADLPGVEQMVGLFINTLPLRVSCASDQIVRDWLKALHAQQAAMRQYEYSPLVEIQGWSDVPRGVPLFESLVVVENYPVAEALREQPSSLAIRDVRSFERTNFPLLLEAAPGRELALTLNYDTQRIEAAAVDRLLGQLQTILTSLATDVEQPLHNVPLLTEAERRRIVVEWNTTARALPAVASIADLFETQAARTPDALAVSYENQRLTYAELNTRANQLAHWLRTLDVGPDVLVGVSMDRSLELIVAVLGILKAGGAYLPLDPTYPAERLQFMLHDARPRVVLTRTVDGERSTLGDGGGTDAARWSTVDLVRDWPQIARHPDTNPARDMTPDDLAYVIYTSGSTGKPKGVLLHQRGLINLVLSQIEAFALGPESRLLQFASFSFDASVSEIFTTLVAGATLVLADRATLQSPLELGAVLREQAISVVTLPPSLLAVLPTAGLDGLRTVVSAGEACPVEVARRWWRGRRFINGYGPTETTVGPCAYIVDELPADAITVPIGRPLPNVQVYLLDRFDQPVPVGVAGEICVGGVGVARGYLHRPDLTAEKFVRNPFEDHGPQATDEDSLKSRRSSSVPRLYRTGDLGRYRADGTLEYVGRIDHQIKLRGFRIELGEIEAALKQQPGVREAVALAREDAPGDQRLVAYVVPQPDQTLNSGTLRDALKRTLPEYMLPSALVVIDTLPLTANGKLDRAALPAPDRAQAEEATYVAPRTAEEELLAGVWAQVLGLQRVGIDDSFFELGGHSLLATQAISRIRDAFGIELPLRTLFEAPTVRGLAGRIAAARFEMAGQVAPSIAPVDRTLPLPLSFAQQRLWFLDQLEPNSPLYNNPTALHLSGQVDVDALRRAIATLVQRHEALRTTFGSVDGQPVQVIAPEITVPFQVIALDTLPAAEREAEARRRATVDAQTPFDLHTGPLLRFTLLKLAETEHVALINLHHIISDGWSVKVLIGEVAALYAAYTVGRDAQLGALPVHYADYAVWQRQWLQGDVLQRQLAYWTEQLQDAPPVLELPTDRPRPAVQSFRGATRSFALPAALSAEVTALSRRENVTPFMTLLAAFQTLLHRYSGQDDISVGTPIANRTRGEIEGLIGFFVNTLVLRTKLADNPTFRDVLVDVRDTTLNAYAHQDVPFEMVVEAVQPQRNLSHTPLFQVMFVLDNAPATKLELPGLTLQALDTESGTARFDLTLALGEGADGFSGAIEYNSDLFDPPTIERLIGHYETLLRGIVDDPDQEIGALPLLTAAERAQLVIAWNRTDAPFAANQCFHDLVTAQAERTPAALAARFGEHTLTYSELESRANQLAHHLQQLGVGPDTIVGLCVERSLDLVIGALGVLKAGGAFLPLDPAYPAERLQFMLQDAQPRVVLARATDDKWLVDAAPWSVSDGPWTVVDLVRDWPQIAQQPQTPPATPTTPDNLAYVIYTSGSTGQPKGTLLQHRGLCNLAAAHAANLRLGVGDHVLQFAALSFDAAVWELCMALSSGATLVLAQQATLASAPDLLKLLRTERITIATLPPSLLAVLPPAELPELRIVVAAGEACSRDLVQQWQPGRRFIDAYGPTETTVCASWYECHAADALPPAIGRPLPNFKLYVLDRYEQPTPIGVPGELHIGGVGVARGYLNRPKLTAEKFVRDPFSSQPDARLYKTGDLARYRADGNLEFLGRIDQQVKLRGFRIELGEIEAALRQHPGVQDSLVIAHATAGDTRLIGYVVAAEAAVNSAHLRAFLGDKLPGYMVPSAIVRLDAWPMTPSNKLDRRALPLPDGARPELERAYVAPRTPTETKLADLCGALLGIERVGVDDNFFELGGHSLLATQLLARVRDTFGVDVPLRAVFEQPTVAGMAQEIERQQQRGAQPDAPAITRVARDARRARRSTLNAGAGNGAVQPDLEDMSRKP